MFIVHVTVRVKPQFEEAFKTASTENARNSLLEPGVVRFDVGQSLEDPAEFVLVEVYKTEADAALHKETAHYKAWRDAVESMMAEPRRSKKFKNVCPTDANWQ
jgi:autoinducer 2-degrading protein